MEERKEEDHLESTHFENTCNETFIPSIAYVEQVISLRSVDSSVLLGCNTSALEVWRRALIKAHNTERKRKWTGHSQKGDSLLS